LEESKQPFNAPLYYYGSGVIRVVLDGVRLN